jgi:A/G-specific adenine glycosylase
VEQYDGVVPSNEEQISKLKGIGPYTKGAILSIAYNLPVPAVDGNVMRVFSRLYAMDKDISLVSTRKEVEEMVRSVIPIEDPSSFNQALMELGALICTPRNPKCSICPVAEYCEAREKGLTDQLPVKNAKVKKRDVELITVVPVYRNLIYIHRRDEELLKGLWEYPTWERDKEEISAERLSGQIYPLFGLKAERFTYLGHYQHIFSHLRWKMEIYLGEVDEQTQPPDDSYRWVSFDELLLFPFPVPHQKVYKKFSSLMKSHR